MIRRQLVDSARKRRALRDSDAHFFSRVFLDAVTHVIQDKPAHHGDSQYDQPEKQKYTAKPCHVCCSCPSSGRRE
jgi:hypothetical protein